MFSSSSTLNFSDIIGSLADFVLVSSFSSSFCFHFIHFLDYLSILKFTFIFGYDIVILHLYFAYHFSHAI